MAVTLIIGDFTEPTGELTEDLFPGSVLNDLLEGWLEQAASTVEANTAIASANHNLAALAWVYYRAYSHVARRLASAPAQVSVDGTVSKTTATDQRKYFAALADSKRADYEGLETESSGGAASPAVPAFFGRARAQLC